MVSWGRRGDTLTLERPELQAQAGKCLDGGNCFPKEQPPEVLDDAKEGMQRLPLNYISRDAQQKVAARPALPRPARLGGHRPPSRTQRQHRLQVLWLGITDFIRVPRGRECSWLQFY